MQKWKPSNDFKLTRVGVKGMKKPVQVHREREITLTCKIDVFVDLPSSQKGSHMSRNIEVIDEILDESVRETVPSLESLCAKIAKTLLRKHAYATRSEVKMEADYFLEKSTPLGKKSLEGYELIAKAIALKNNTASKLIGVRVKGMTACPCALETVKEVVVSEKPHLKNALREIPYITHNQRNITTLMIEVPEHYDVEANDLINIVEESLSSPTFELLKRRDESEVVLRAHQNPKFVEDVVRDILGKVLERYHELPDDVVVTVASESEESIHKHNAYAERVTTLGELRA